MFEVGFSELLLISVIALVVLGPERLPKLVGQVGRWVGKARSMARQFREQLESEVNLDEMTRSTPKSSSTSSPGYPPPGEAPPNEPNATSDALSTAHMDEPAAPTGEPGIDPDTQHRPTADYPYAGTGFAGTDYGASGHHPESDVYGGAEAAAPEQVTPEEEPPAATPATDEPPGPANGNRV